MDSLKILLSSLTYYPSLLLCQIEGLVGLGGKWMISGWLMLAYGGYEKCFPDLVCSTFYSETRLHMYQHISPIKVCPDGSSLYVVLLMPECFHRGMNLQGQSNLCSRPQQ